VVCGCLTGVQWAHAKVREAVLAPRQGLLKGKDRLYAARAFFEALQLQKDRKVHCRAPGSAVLATRQPVETSDVGRRNNTRVHAAGLCRGV
jgi:hypothetical protein